jgi:hypothetical protein
LVTTGEEPKHPGDDRAGVGLSGQMIEPGWECAGERYRVVRSRSVNQSGSGGDGYWTVKVLKLTVPGAPGAWEVMNRPASWVVAWPGTVAVPTSVQVLPSVE